NVPDREDNTRERNGIALSGTWAATDKLDLIADYYHIEAFDRIDLGSFINRDTGKVYKDIPSYVQDNDFVKSRVDTATLRAKYQFSDNVRIENALRHGTTNNGYVVTGASGTTTDATDPNGEYDTIRLSTHQGWQEVDYLVNQLNVFFDTAFAGMDHQFVFGAEYSQHNVVNGNYNVNNAGASNCTYAGRGGVSNGYCIVDANGNTVSNVSGLLDRQITKGNQDSDYQIDTLSTYVMDTIDVTDSFSVFAGVRADTFEYSNAVTGRDGVTTDYEYDDTLWNGHIGAMYDITEDGNVYITYSTSANINGGESDVGGNCGYGGLCSTAENVDKAKPEDVQNIEVGTKWNILDDKLLATLAIFRITKDNVMEGTDYDTEGTYNTGKNRVQGAEVSLVGNINNRLSTQFGLALMESEILESANPENEGGRLANFADRSAFLQLRYQLTDKFAFGSTANYSSEVHVGQPDSAASEDTYVPAYTVVDAFATYDFSDKLNARLNVGNVTDKDYYLTAYRSGSFAYIGDARNAQLSLAYEF
ncbi:MAG: TonB-dependent receptor, partial [Oleibacter sp.]|nr:TonB-dependent receptor [Thalassolituus sp.]